ncbi:transposase-like protein [Corynebacterium diphtheriae DSM 43988]|nr:transposase-like protein [Corynebacterium diphtheriae DSM 43988]
MTRYPFEVKLRAVELFNAGWRPADIAVECELRSKMSVYSWAQRHREEGKWGLMSKRERKEHTRMPTRAAFEKSLADDPAELKKQMAQLFVDKAVLEKELELVKKTSASSPGQLSNKHKAEVVDALRGEFPLYMLLLILRHQASTTNSNSDLFRVSTRISAKCFMRLVLSRITPTAIADFGGNCAIAGSLSVRRSFAVSCTKREFVPGSRNESGVTPAIKGKFLPHHLTW